MTSIFFFAFSFLFSFYCRNIVLLFSLLLFGEVQRICHVHYFVLVFQWVSLEGVVTHTKPGVIVGCNNTKQSNLNLCSRKLFGLFWRSLAHSEFGYCPVHLHTRTHTHLFPPHAACPVSLRISSFHLSHANQHVFSWSSTKASLDTHSVTQTLVPSYSAFLWTLLEYVLSLN